MRLRTGIWTIATLCVFIAVLAVPVGVHAGKPPVCAFCGQPIVGPVFQTKGRFYHPDHFRCAYCGQPITGPYTENDGKNYHTDCYRNHVAVRCALCGAIIHGEYLQDFWGNSYCSRHEGEAPVCDSCGRFISEQTTGGGVRYDDGRYICNICRPKVVANVDDILLIVHEVADKMAAFGMKVDYNGIKIHLVGRPVMQKLSGHHSDGLRGFTDYREDFRFFGITRNRRMDMYLLYGMPRMELISTIAHELAHVYQFNHGHFKNDRMWAEGSCNYAAYLVLGCYPGKESSFFRTSLVRDDDNVYGRGFRRVKTLAEARGTEGWLRDLAHATNFPAGY